MEAETMRRAFEPFFTTKARDTGAGLGLTTVYGIVKQAGGHVSLYSEPQMGTTVRVYLPASDEMLPAADRAVAAEPLDGQQRTVLLVEDEDAVRELTERILGRHGYHVIEAAGPVQAIELYQRRGQSIDLLLTDVIMPQMNGRALAERIRQQQPGIRVLYMSGYPGDLIAFHGELAEGVDLLQKPFTEESLLRAAQRVLMGSKATPPSQIEGGGREAA
jgi:CheY-like chemotaxis protein